MTLDEIITVAARYLEKARADLTIDNVDFGLVAANQVRRTAEQLNDFNFTRKFLTVSVDGVTGGSLDEAVEYGMDCSCKLSVKTILDAGVFDTAGNFNPVEWTTTEDSLNRQRLDNSRWVPRYPTDGQAVSAPFGQQRFLFGGRKVFYFPRTTNLIIPLAFLAYTFTPDWTADDLDSEPTNNDPWIVHGAQYLQWQTLIQLNHLFKGFVFRQEGNLPPPQTLADAGLASMQTWDNFGFEQFRRHSR